MFDSVPGCAPWRIVTFVGKYPSLSGPDRRQGLQNLLRRSEPGSVGSVGGRKIMTRAGFAGEEQPVVNRGSQRDAGVGMADPGVGIGTACKWIAGPPRRRDETEMLPHVVSKPIRDLTNGKP